ncbi:MAG: O-antigen ligase family protein [Patescibacteria group bacterium]|nr:O-antigen ligase family protein [Patescibacteria group bacterium]
MKPQLLFWIFVTIIPFSFALNPTQGIDLSLTRIFVPILFLFWLAYSLKEKHFLLDKRIRLFFLLGIALLSLLSIFWAIDQQRATRKILFLFSLMPLYFISFALTQKEETKTFLYKILAWGSFTVSVFAIIVFCLQFIFGINFPLDLASRFIAPVFLGNTFSDIVATFPSWLVNIQGRTILRTFGTFPDPHLFSLYINMVLPLTVYLYIKEKKRLYLAFAITLFIASALAFSRAAYLSLIFGLIFLFLSSKPICLIKKYILATTVLATFLFYIVAIPNPLTQRLESSFDTKEGSNKGRIEMWQKGIEITTTHPFGGVGIGNFSRYIQPTSQFRDPIYAHNLFLDFSSEIGILGASLLFCLVLSPIFAFLKKPTLFKKLLATSFLIFLVHSFFETPIYSIRVFPLFLILLSLKSDDE